MHDIVKYKNRKMYSRTQKQYVTLQDVRDLLISGKTVQISDYDGVNITSKVLSKVVGVTENVPVSELETLITNN